MVQLIIDYLSQILKEKMDTIWSKEADKILRIGSPMSDGIQNWALTRKQTMFAVEKLLLARIPILGGDVCTLQNGRVFPNSDGWYYSRRENEHGEEFLNNSIGRARDYIRAYCPTCENIFFNIVPGEPLGE